MRKIRVLVVDDSSVVRRMISEALTSDPELEVAGTAPNGKIALDKLPQIVPDVVTLDIEMPGLGGLETIAPLRAQYPKLPVIMFSTLTRKGAVDTLNALSLGATDYVTKPSNTGSLAAGLLAVKQDLIPKIKALCGRFRGTDDGTARAVPTVIRSWAERAPRGALLAVGVSTGGPNALTTLFQSIPADFPVPIVIVQHMPKLFTHYLAERLNALSPLSVAEAQGEELLRPGMVRIAPGDFHLVVGATPRGWVTRLHQLPPENSCRPAVDVLFHSVAETVGSAAVGVVLTGMGQDGLRGSRAIRAAGGRMVVQDEPTSVVWGMPGAVAQAGLANYILPLQQIGPRLTQFAWTSDSSMRSANKGT